MEIKLEEVVKLYKAELAAKTEECMLRRVIQAELAEEINRLKKELEVIKAEAEREEAEREEQACTEN